MKAGVVVFPGTNCDRDTFVACEEFGWETEYIWHTETKIDNFDVIFLPGGFSYGDYVRSGALAKFSPVITAIKEFVDKKRGFVVGICNGFQILCECGLLPGALTHNENLKFICKDVQLILAPTSPLATLPKKTIKYRFLRGKVCFQYEQRLANIRKQGEGYCNQSTNLLLTLPIAHAEGRYIADEETIEKLKKEDMIFLTYKDNPNGSVENIAGLYDKKRKIIGMMPHPERAFFKELGNEDGKIIFELIQDCIENNK